MNRIQQALMMGGVLIAIALLAVFGIVPQAIAQYAPLVVLPFVLRRRACCSLRRQGRGA